MQNHDHIHYTPRDGFDGQSLMNINHDIQKHFESCWNGSGDFGNLQFVKTEIRPGFDIWFNDCSFHKKIHFSMAYHPAAFSFSFCLSGNSITK